MTDKPTIGEYLGWEQYDLGPVILEVGPPQLLPDQDSLLDDDA